MAEFYRTKCMVVLKENDDLGLADKGVEWVECYIDLLQIESFHYDQDYEDEECTQVKCKSGDVFSLQLTVGQTAQILRNKGIIK